MAACAVIILLIFQGTEENYAACRSCLPSTVLFYMAFPGGNIEDVVIRPAFWAQRTPADFVNMVNSAGVDIERIVEGNMFAAVDKASPSLLPAL